MASKPTRGSTVQLSPNYVAVLHASLAPSPNSTLAANQWQNKTPVIFVHGFSQGSGFGGNDGTWGKLPALVSEYLPSSVILNFQWRTDTSYLTVAKELAKAVDYAYLSTGKKVHIVAHSFGGVLSRVMLQNLTGTTASAAAKVATLTTAGSPHSGIVANSPAQVQVTGGSVLLPVGWGSVGKPSFCMQITCYQSGLNANVAQWAIDSLADSAPTGAGYVNARLATTRANLPSNLSIRVLIGQTINAKFRNTLSNLIFYSDDGLITYLGQRFIPATTAPSLLSNASIGGATVTERVLGLDPTLGGNAAPGTAANVSWMTSYSMNFNLFDSQGVQVSADVQAGYKHSSAAATLITSGGTVITPNSEVYVPTDCGSASSCLHDTWVNLKEVFRPYVVTPSTATGALNDTGITASQCYAAGSNTLVSCTSAAALALNSQQDGMVGRDVTSSDSTDGKLGFSYTKIGANGETLPASATSWSCVKDNVTGLIWEVKTADGGLRDKGKTYTNYDSTVSGQNGSTPLTQAQIDAATNSVGFKNAINAATLCGANDWRLPTIKELESLVDYGVSYPGPTIDASWFPNTVGTMYWSSSPNVASTGYTWYVNFTFGFVDYTYGYRPNTLPVRLVRASQ